MCSVAQSCLTLCDPIDCSPPGFSAHGIIQARILEWVAISYSQGSSWPRDWTWVFCNSCVSRQILYYWKTLHPVNIYTLGLSQASGPTMVIEAQRWGWQTCQTLQKLSSRILFWSFSIVISLVKLLSRVRLFAIPWTVAYQAPPSWDFSGNSTGVGCHFLLQGIFPPQGSNLGLPHCRQTLYRLSHQRSPLYH